MKNLIAEQLGRWVLAREGHAFCTRFRMANAWFWKSPIAVEWNSDTSCYEVRDTDYPRRGERIFIARRERVFRYRRGVADRLRRLARKYFIDKVPLADGDVVIDCGANVGEISLYLKSRVEVHYHAIEPSAQEAAACDVNVYGGRSLTERCALWHEAGTLTFYENNATGDSSLIEPPRHVSEVTVPTTTVSAVAERIGAGRIQLLKVEGEGAEPEILRGAVDVLGSVAYCTVDCGPERGKAEAHVIPDVCNFMLDNGFEILDVNLDRQIFLFRNRAGAVT